MVDRDGHGGPFVGELVEFLVVTSLVEGHLDSLLGGAYLELGLRGDYGGGTGVMVHLLLSNLRGTHAHAIWGNMLDLSEDSQTRITGMVGFKGVGTDERAGTTFLNGWVAFIISWAPTADTLIGITFLTGTDHSAVVIVGGLLNIT